MILRQFLGAARDPSPQRETHLCVVAIAMQARSTRAYLLTVGEPQSGGEAIT
jgi:hypothetical protein